jgi:hypothetical protein
MYGSVRGWGGSSPGLLGSILFACPSVIESILKYEIQMKNKILEFHDIIQTKS